MHPPTGRAWGRPRLRSVPAWAAPHGLGRRPCLRASAPPAMPRAGPGLWAFPGPPPTDPPHPPPLLLPSSCRGPGPPGGRGHLVPHPPTGHGGGSSHAPAHRPGLGAAASSLCSGRGRARGRMGPAASLCSGRGRARGRMGPAASFCSGLSRAPWPGGAAVSSCLRSAGHAPGGAGVVGISRSAAVVVSACPHLRAGLWASSRRVRQFRRARGCCARSRAGLAGCTCGPVASPSCLGLRGGGASWSGRAAPGSVPCSSGLRAGRSRSRPRARPAGSLGRVVHGLFAVGPCPGRRVCPGR
ncbi:hypothetical protein RKD22_000471 [Streptomyces pristinaespiralis]